MEVKAAPKAAKKVAKKKPEVPKEVASSASKGEPSLPVDDDMAEQPMLDIPEVVALAPSDRRFDELATVDGKRAVKPTLLFKLTSGGEIWLSGIPTAQAACVS